MVKKKGSRDINPADAFRKEQRAKEIARNKKERKFLRDAHKMKSDPNALKEELKEVLELEEDGKLNMTVRLKKRALQGAYDQAIKKKKEEAVRAQEAVSVPVFNNEYGHGVPEQQPENSVYYHPTLNPSGVPPPGKPQRYRTDPTNGPRVPLPVPAAPPLPAGPAPGRPTPPSTSAALLPPPLGPPPGVLPPPAGPPPGMLPAPAGPPPGMAYGGVVPPPMGPPPGMLPPPGMPPPGYSAPPSVAPSRSAAPGHEKKTTITGQSTVTKLPRAQDDRTVTSMVPASVRVRREEASASSRAVLGPGAKGRPTVGPGFGLAPALFTSSAVRPAAPAARPAGAMSAPAAKPAGPATTAVDRKYQAFLAEMSELGAV
ncbi:hypothetical protein CVIRNUC_007282 [Coccomyxa viridis]|uniref:Wbp11/ELF5/Saf1 N-terminal domain-containing protein n=1 Tax=Coccomyxa viridis TaxID=1274662 RepID=A0AAV1I9N6_9CHLO|nr:hypothetical protein CVIRNUC_007282 [Coccomyxa viridis]